MSPATSWLASWLTALRIARREARRAKGRSTLVLALIMLPVVCLSFAAVSYDSFRLTPAEQLDRTLGTADAVVHWPYTGPIRQAVDNDELILQGGPATAGQQESSAAGTRARQTPASAAELAGRLPAGSRLIRYRTGTVEVKTATGVGDIEVAGLDAADPLTRGIVTLRKGRAPAGGDQVAVTEQATHRLGTGLGGTVRLGDGSRRYTVVGIVEFPARLDEHLLFPPDTVPLPPDKPNGQNTDRWLVDTPAPLTWTQVKQLNLAGIAAISRHVVLDPPPAAEMNAYFPINEGSSVRTLASEVLIAGLAALEVVLLAGPAFAVGARRRRRDLALVAANGGTPAHLRRIVLADGVVLGLAGAVLGNVLGIVVAFATRPVLEEQMAHVRAGGYRVFPLALAGVAGLAVAVGLLAALVPAFSAARQSVVAALTGRRGAVRSRKRWLVLGLAMAALGAAVTGAGAHRISTNIILAGLIIGELGLVLCTPSLVGLISRAGRLLPLAPRIALRDTARNRAAAAPAISAVMAAVAGSLALGVYLDSQRAQEEVGYVASLPEGYAAVTFPRFAAAADRQSTQPSPATLTQLTEVARSSLPVQHVVAVQVPGCPAGMPSDSYCDIGADLPPENRCPLDLVRDRRLTRAEQRTGRHDPRCKNSYRIYGGGFTAVVDDGTALPTLTGASGPDIAAATATLHAGGVVVTDPLYLSDDGKVTLILYGMESRSDQEQVTSQGQGQASSQGQDQTAPQGQDQTAPRESPKVTLPGYALTSGTRLPNVVLSKAAMAATKMATAPGGVAIATTRMPTQAEEDSFRAAVRTVARNWSYTVERGPHTRQDPMLIILAGAAGLITLGAAGIATGLAAADGRADLSTLAAVGASPRVRRSLSLSQSGVIAGLGSGLGMIAGIGAAFAVLFALNQAYVDQWPAPAQYPLRVPWNALAVLLAVPVVAMLGSGLLTRSRLPIERRLD